MKRYANIHTGAIASVELFRTSEGVQACIHLHDEQSLPLVENKINTLGHSIISKTHVDKQPLLIVNAECNEADFIQKYSSLGGRLVSGEEKKPFDAWKVRSLLGFGGQTLQLISSFMKHKVDAPQLTFAATNLTANGINLAYKAQKHGDPHQLRMLKQTINEKLSPLLDEGVHEVAVDDNRALLRERNRPKAIAPAEEFMRKNSVNVGELGLRYIGAINLAYPYENIKAAARNGTMPAPNGNKYRSFTGFASITGKAIATTSKIPDPYNPKKATWLDHVREKYSFLVGGLVEAVAFSVMTFDSFANTKPTGNIEIDKARSLRWRGEYHRDWLGAIGSGMFVTGYIVRSWAKFGERNVDLPELYAHTSDMIAKLPPEKIPQALADTSAYLSDHFKGKPGLSFGIIYNKIGDDLCREHHITINPKSHQMAITDVPTSDVAVTHAIHPATMIHTHEVEHSVPAQAAAKAI